MRRPARNESPSQRGAIPGPRAATSLRQRSRVRVLELRQRDLRHVDERTLAVELIELVIAARFGLQDVHDDVDVVEQHPPAEVRAFRACVVLAERFELDVDLVVERLDVRARQAGDEDEIIGDAQVIGDVVDLDVDALLAVSEGGGGRGDLERGDDELLWGRGPGF